MSLSIILLLGSAIAINVIVWIKEIRQLRLVTFALDLIATLFIVSISGGGSYLMAASLFSSLIVSAYLNRAKRRNKDGKKVRLIPDLDLLIKR